MSQTSPSVREDAELETRTVSVTQDTIDFPELPVADGLTDYERQRMRESADDQAARRASAAATRGSNTIDQHMASRRPVRAVDENTIYRFDVPLSIHEQRILSLAPEGDEVLGYVADATNFLQSTREVLTRIDAAYKLSMQDTTITPDARSARLEKEAGAAFTKAFEGHGRTLEALRKRIAHTEGELNTPMTTAAATPRSNELRTVLRLLAPAKVNEAIRDAINAEPRSPQQAELLQATLGAHALTVGITEQEQAVHQRAYNEKTNPQTLRRLDLLKKALAVVESVKPDLLRDTFQKSFRSSFTRASAIRGMGEAAAAALAKINNPGA